MDFSRIPGFGEVKTHIKYNGFWDWLIKFNNIYDLWQAQPSYIYVQSFVIVGFFVVLYHALKNKGRFVQLFIGIILHSMIVEIITYNLPDVDNFWHSQTPIMLVGQRLPLHIIFLYVIFYYYAVVAIDKLKLPLWSEPLAVGLALVLIDYPYDLLSIRFMHWSWHDTDPNIFDRHYHVPWNSFYFHTVFGASFIFWFHFTRRLILGKTKKWELSKSCSKEFACTSIAALLGMPGGVLLFIPLYHPLHDRHGIHSEVTFFFLVAICLSVICLSFPKNSKSENRSTQTSGNFIMLCYAIVHYVLFIGIAVFLEPSSEISTGLHEPIGPCNETTNLHTAFGDVLKKRKYLCVEDNDESYFRFSCLPNGIPPHGALWYTICGVPFKDRLEYIVLLSTVAVFGISFFFTTLYSIGRPSNRASAIDDRKKIKSN